MRALRLKAAVFSDGGWQEHWSRSGPSLLASAWSSLFPHIPLSSVETATGLEFLVSAACASGEGGEGVMGEIVRATGALEITGDDESAVSHDMSHDSLVTPPSDEEIRRLWGEVYNTQYWYWYQRWREDLAQNGGEEGEGGCVEGECGEGGCVEGECEEGGCEEGECVEGKCVEGECGEGGCVEGECEEGGCEEGECVEGKCVEGECGEGGCVEGGCEEGGCEEGECGEGGCQGGEICEESGDRAKGGNMFAFQS